MVMGDLTFDSLSCGYVSRECVDYLRRRSIFPLLFGVSSTHLIGVGAKRYFYVD